MGASPSVADITIKVNFMDHEGNRKSIPARIGQTLLEAAEMHKIDLGFQLPGGPIDKVHSERWTEDVFGEGPGTGFDHVIVTNEWISKLPPRHPAEEELLYKDWDEDEITPSSRLACMITLTKDLDGLQLYLPPRVYDEEV